MVNLILYFYHYFFGYKMGVFPFQNNLIALDDSRSIGLFWNRKTPFIAELHKTDLHICSDFAKIFFHLKTK